MRMNFFLLALSASALLASPALAQDGDEREGSSEFSGQVSASAVIASDRGVEDEEQSRSGAILRGSLEYERDLGDGAVLLEYDSALYIYEEDERDERWTNRIALTYSHEIFDDLVLSPRISYATNLPSPEGGSPDQTEALATLEYSPGDHRVRLFSGWRWREYSDEDGSSGDGPVFGGEYRYRLASRNFISGELRYESINSDNPRRSFNRTIAEAFYQHPIGPLTRLRVGAVARWLNFDSRFVDGVRRKDRSFTPELQLLHGADEGFLLRGRLQYGFRSSTDPEFDEDDQRATLTAGYRF